MRLTRGTSFSGFRRRIVEQHRVGGVGAAKLGVDVVERRSSDVHVVAAAAVGRRVVVDVDVADPATSHNDARQP